MANLEFKTLKNKRGNNEKSQSYVGDSGEITVNTDNWKLHVHDGITPGGHVIGNADAEYTSSDPSTVAIGGLPIGFTAPSGISVDKLIDQMLHPYQSPAFTSFSINGLKTYEVGDTFPENPTFTFTLSNQNNVKPNTLKIEDITNSTVLISNGELLSPCSTESSEIQKTTESSHVFRISAVNSKDVVFSKDVTINWRFAIYYGTSSNSSLDSVGVNGLQNKILGTNATGTYAFGEGGYKYLAIPSLFAEPKSFINADNGFSIAINPPDTALITNTFGQEIEYKIYRSTFELGGAIKMKVE